MQTLTRLYDNHDAAAAVVNQLEASGVPHSDISIVSNDADGRLIGGDTTDDAAATGAGTGASIGTVLGGGAGLLAGIGALAIPGVGPIVAAGWLVAALTGAGVGAAAGGLLGSLTGAGVSEEDSHVYAEGVRRGGTLVTVRADDAQAARLQTMLDGTMPVDVATRRGEYQTEGWNEHDVAATPYTAEQVAEERRRRVAGVQ